ncbi:hypothetical protein FHX82_002291 [Amycolatopsis bartoniae]|uniref:Uncharacterized protein n=1 Tax=Amycolatopsis bartoniae TaxID=941986 RepID=A0A8H9MA87_9PSEU|nr:hypothetical protein [Amycolatopsis bartoniae]MBB2935271.1 hypothetical protein [Amycolatopsis bartoniae]TVT06820.1 hypothetical protein FNH07_18830 [Amycolatopsis bartoniae]GHF55643.1 hypothetical protein GCM10017566_30840 [Amycolatopsis bartoniae]
MSGSVEVRQFLLRYEGGDAAGGVPSQRGGQADAPRVSDDQVRRARLAVAAGALDAEDCAQLLDMLGLIPDEDGQIPAQR